MRAELSANRVVLFLKPCIIADCGEHQQGDDWGVAPNDGSGDLHPDFPEDADIDFKDVGIKCLGTTLYAKGAI